jgi:hypothetical protein
MLTLQSCQKQSNVICIQANAEWLESLQTFTCICLPFSTWQKQNGVVNKSHLSSRWIPTHFMICHSKIAACSIITGSIDTEGTAGSCHAAAGDIHVCGIAVHAVEHAKCFPLPLAVFTCFEGGAS